MATTDTAEYGTVLDRTALRITVENTVDDLAGTVSAPVRGEWTFGVLLDGSTALRGPRQPHRQDHDTSPLDLVDGLDHAITVCRGDICLRVGCAARPSAPWPRP
ncbi:hypothetical protein FAIPA1_350021 [Frankia sp. AiPs1]